MPAVILNYTYDALGNVASVSDQDGVTVTSTWGVNDLLESRTWTDTAGTADIASARADFDFNAIGRLTGVERYSDSTGTALFGSTTRTWDLAGRTDQLTHADSVGSLLAGYDYDYDFASLLTQETRTHQNPAFNQTVTYDYDLRGQLLDAVFSAQENETFDFDASGNRVASTSGSDSRSYTSVTANQLTSDSDFRYEYDGEGNLVKRIELLAGWK